MESRQASGGRGAPARSVIGAQDIKTGLLAATAAAVSIWGLWEGWWRAPIEQELKMSQKIFYYHAPLGAWTILLTLIAAFAAAHYLWRRSESSDLLCEACMEVGMVACGVTLVTGMLWAKPAWGDWFPWGEPRITSMLVLFLIAMAYVALRSSIDEPDRRARFSSVLAVIGAIDAVIAYSAIHIWNTTHPRVITPKGIGLQEDMKRAFFICMAAMGLWVWALVAARLRLARLRSAVERFEHEAQERLDARA